MTEPVTLTKAQIEKEIEVSEKILSECVAEGVPEFELYPFQRQLLMSRLALKGLEMEEKQAAFEAMLAALEPFVYAVQEFDNSWSKKDEIDLVFDDSYGARIKFEAFLKARAAVEQAKAVKK